MNQEHKGQDHKGLHPVIWIAAIAITLASFVAIAKMSGWIGPSAEPTLAAATQEKAAVASKKEEANRKALRESQRQSVSRGTGRTTPEPVYSQSERSPAINSYPAARRYCDDCGVVEAVRTVQVPAKASGAGAVAGGVVGGVLGHQVGEGKGKDVATVAGAVIGGFTGHQVEKKVRTTTRYEVDVTMADGTRRSIPYASRPGWNRGDEVQVRNGVISASTRRNGVESL